MPRLLLLGSQSEDVQGVVIDHVDADKAHQLRTEAKLRQDEWFANPTSEAHRLAYARALMRLGRYTLDAGMCRHAERLMRSEDGGAS